MNTQKTSSHLGIIVSVEENNGGKVLIAKLENSDCEVGRAWLSMPGAERDLEAQGFLFMTEISPMAPDMELVKLVLMAKAQELLPKNQIVISHDGDMPQGVKAEEFSKGTHILNPRHVPA